MSPEELKTLLTSPLALFVVMLLGSLTNGLKQLATARQSGGASVSLGSYLAHWPETAATVIANVLAFATLVTTDQLNFASALGIGFAANSAADLLRSGGRSGSLGGKQGGFARIGMLVLLAIGAAVLLSGCTTTPVDVIQTACTPGTTYTAERCAKGVGETYEVYQKRAADIVANPAAPAEVKEAVKAAESLASDVVVKTLKAGAFYAEVKQQLAAGLTTEEQVAIANASLEAWVAKAIPLIRSFGDALGR